MCLSNHWDCASIFSQLIFDDRCSFKVNDCFLRLNHVLLDPRQIRTDSCVNSGFVLLRAWWWTVADDADEFPPRRRNVCVDWQKWLPAVSVTVDVQNVFHNFHFGISLNSPGIPAEVTDRTNLSICDSCLSVDLPALLKRCALDISLKFDSTLVAGFSFSKSSNHERRIVKTLVDRRFWQTDWLDEVAILDWTSHFHQGDVVELFFAMWNEVTVDHDLRNSLFHHRRCADVCVCVTIGISHQIPFTKSNAT